MPPRSSQIRHRLLVAAYVVGIALVILLLPARFTTPARLVFTEAVAPFEEALFGAAGDTLATTGTLRDALLAEERDRMAERTARRLRNRNIRLREMVLDRQQRLRRYEDLEISGARFRVLSTRVTSYDSTSSRHSIVVRSGSTDGVREGLAVTAAGALVGIVSRVGPWHSRVRLITDVGSRIPCRVQRTRQLCLVRGTGGVNCSVEWVRRDANVKDGDLLVTSPVEDVLSEPPVLPRGLPVATIIRSEPGRKQPLFRDVTAAPRADPSRLEMVEIFIPSISAPPASSPEGS